MDSRIAQFFFFAAVFVSAATPAGAANLSPCHTANTVVQNSLAAITLLNQAPLNWQPRALEACVAIGLSEDVKGRALAYVIGRIDDRTDDEPEKLENQSLFFRILEQKPDFAQVSDTARRLALSLPERLEKALISAGLFLSVQDWREVFSDGFVPLWQLKRALRLGMNPEAGTIRYNYSTGQTLLTQFATVGRRDTAVGDKVRSLEMIKLLLEAGIDPNGDRVTPAIVAAADSSGLDAVKLLLDHGAKIDAVSAEDGMTALIRATSGGQYEMVKLLISRGASLDLADKQGLTALDHAESIADPHAACPVIAALLKSAGAHEGPSRKSP